jgi:hypothetical protein
MLSNAFVYEPISAFMVRARTNPLGSSEARLILLPVLILSAALFASKVALFNAFAEISALALETVIILLIHQKILIFSITCRATVLQDPQLLIDLTLVLFTFFTVFNKRSYFLHFYPSAIVTYLFKSVL